MNRLVRIFETAQDFYEAAAGAFVEAANGAIADRGAFRVALSGGNTPRGLYALLTTDPWRGRIDWTRVFFFFGDERHVPPDHPDSNYRMANEALLSKLSLRPHQVWPIKGECPDAAKAAAEYEQVLREQIAPAANGIPQFDLVLLGLGPDGHTLSLFPGTKALDAPADRLAVSNWVGKFFTDRITITAQVANQARRVVFLVRGADKQLALKAVLEGPFEPFQLPAQLIQPSAAPVVWLLDGEAARLLAEPGKKTRDSNSP